MKTPVERIHVSQSARDNLVTLKRRTGIEHWNVLCRWALLDSLANPNKPISSADNPESNVEMTWSVFAGEISDVLLAVFELRARKDGISDSRSERASYFKAHLERGISQLQSAKTLVDLISRVKVGATSAQKSNNDSSDDTL